MQRRSLAELVAESNMLLEQLRALADEAEALAERHLELSRKQREIVEEIAQRRDAR